MKLGFIFVHIDCGKTFKYRYALTTHDCQVIYESKVYQSVNNQAEMINAHRRAIYEAKKLSRNLSLVTHTDSALMNFYLNFDRIDEKLEDTSFEAFRRLNEELEGIDLLPPNIGNSIIIEYKETLKQSIEEDGN